MSDQRSRESSPEHDGRDLSSLVADKHTAEWNAEILCPCSLNRPIDERPSSLGSTRACLKGNEIRSQQSGHPRTHPRLQDCISAPTRQLGFRSDVAFNSLNELAGG